MRIATLLLLAAPVWAQAPLKPLVAPSTERASVPRKVFTDLESDLDYKLRIANDKDPFDLLGLTRGLYLPGYGVVLTTEISLIATPTINPFRLKITPEEAAKVHQRKIDHLPLLRKTMQGLWKEAALALTSIPDNEQVVLAFRLLYQPWEDTTGLPGQIVMKGTRKAALTGDIQTEEE
jgi:hypothetical protein